MNPIKLSLNKDKEISISSNNKNKNNDNNVSSFTPASNACYYYATSIAMRKPNHCNIASNTAIIYKDINFLATNCFIRIFQRNNSSSLQNVTIANPILNKRITIKK